MSKIEILDSTLRDGSQTKGISFTIKDKIKIIEILDFLGIHIIEAGNPFSNPKDRELFKLLPEKKLVNSSIAVFGSTRKPNSNIETDGSVSAIADLPVEYVSVVGKCWDYHVTNVLNTTLEENLRMISDTVKYLTKKGKKVIFDAEHFFNSYFNNPDYAMKTLEAACDAGAYNLCLCDTNGAYFPDEIFEITSKVVKAFNTKVGIHCHNDTGMAVAASIMAVKAGAYQVQGTINGYGERCGNADLCTIIPNLQLKMGLDCIDSKNMKNLTYVSKSLSEIANLLPEEKSPYVGLNAFAHKAGMHSDAIAKATDSYEHINPETVGNSRQILMSEVAGRGAIINIIKSIDSTIERNSEITAQILATLKERELEGYQYEGAESSFEILIMKALHKYKPFFKLISFKVIDEPSKNTNNSMAMIKIDVDGQEEITAAEGDGPVNAMDKALRKALERFYPIIAKVKLTDYKVRVLDSNAATAAKVRVIIESSDGNKNWSTIGVSTNIIDASWKALVDSIEYKLFLENELVQL